jgi:hypothetical protein
MSKIVAWFKRTYSKRAARIEREFTRNLWNGK